MKKLMNMRHSAALLVAVALLAICATTAFAQSVTIPSSSNPSNDSVGQAVHTHLQILGDGLTTTPAIVGPPFPGLLYETPASIACIYGLQPASPGCNPNVVKLNPQGGKKAIAIVDFWDDPNAFADLQHFSAQFGLTPITPATFKVVFARSADRRQDRAWAPPLGPLTGQFSARPSKNPSILSGLMPWRPQRRFTWWRRSRLHLQT